MVSSASPLGFSARLADDSGSKETAPKRETTRPGGTNNENNPQGFAPVGVGRLGIHHPQ
jgi:hypothetical protein